MKCSISWIAAPSLGALLCVPSSAQVTQRVNVTSTGTQANLWSEGCEVSGDGSCVAFYSSATNLVPGDTNTRWDVFVRDRQSGTTERVSVSTGGTQGNFDSYNVSLSAEGRYAAFRSAASTLVAGDSNGAEDIFVRDRQTGTTERVSVATGGAQGNGTTSPAPCMISADGRFVAFLSTSSNLVAGDTNGDTDAFVRDRQLGTTERVSVATGGAEGNNVTTGWVAISADGRFVAFRSFATNLVAGDTNGNYDVFVRDRQSATTTRVSVATGGAQGNGACAPDRLGISADGRFVVCISASTNLVAGDTNAADDVFVRDRQSGTTTRVSVATGGTQSNDESLAPAISADGRYVTFYSPATNLVAGDTNGDDDVFLHDRQTGTTERASLTWSGAQGNNYSRGSSVSADGRYLAFDSLANNIVPDDTNIIADVFLRDRTGGTGFTSLCHPGLGGVIACPCSNPPSSAGRGCDNSSATGGAVLSAAGGPYLSSDTLVFTTTGERPTALSILLQGPQVIANGVPYGQGVRCVGGTLRRLFVKSAVAGSITVPEFALGDPSVSERSAEKGDVIAAGQSRWYLVYYRDNVVLGGCSAASTFNGTQTGRLTWSP